MKREGAKQKKRHHCAGSKKKPVCGTLSYLAECRGVVRQSGSTKRPDIPGGTNQIVRKYPDE
jgi:hypothetical protein